MYYFKEYVIGPQCDQCKGSCYNLAPKSPHGCIRCFCMGVTRSCQSSDYYRSQVLETVCVNTKFITIVQFDLKERLTFRGEDQGVTVSDFQETNVETPRYDYDRVPNCMSVSTDSDAPTKYWRMPARLTGNKVSFLYPNPPGTKLFIELSFNS